MMQHSNLVANSGPDDDVIEEQVEKSTEQPQEMAPLKDDKQETSLAEEAPEQIVKNPW